MLRGAAGIVVGTSHEELAHAIVEAGGQWITSAAGVANAVEWGGIRGILVSQEMPGLTPDDVKRWAARGIAVAVWLEDAPPPAWRVVETAVTVWRGDLTEDRLQRWVHGIAVVPPFGQESRLLGVLGVGGDSTRVVLAWSHWMRRERRGGLLVDADWREARLTERLASHIWERGWDYSRLSSVGARPIPLVPAPPPWDAWPREPDSKAVVTLMEHVDGWLLVDLGRDFRQAPAPQWLNRLEALVLVAETATAHRLHETLAAVRDLNRTVTVGLVGSRPDPALPIRYLGSRWPDPEGRKEPVKGRPWLVWPQYMASWVQRHRAQG